jgi:hypothetical protein
VSKDLLDGKGFSEIEISSLKENKSKWKGEENCFNTLS